MTNARTARASAVWLVVLVAGTGLSLLQTGFLFGFNNNYFHLPIVARLYDLPQFAGDAFTQSLRAFSSGLWMLLEGSAAHVPQPALFFALLFVSRALTIGGFMLIAQALGVRSRAGLAVVAGVAALSPLMQGTAYAGHGGLFVNYFTHSELANGVTVLMLWAMQRRRVGTAIGLNGVVFFLNAFMAVWNVAALLAMWLLAHDERAADKRTVAAPHAWRSIAAGVLVALVCAAPVVWRVSATGLLASAGAPFDYRAFLLDYYPYHFLASTIPAAHWVALASVLAVAWAGLQRIGPVARPLAAALAGYMAVYAMGIVLPWFTGSRTLLNLHLLRVSVDFHLIAALALATSAARSMENGDARERWVFAPLLVLCGVAHRMLLPGAAALLLVWPWWRAVLRPARWARPAGVAVLAAAGVAAALAGARQHAATQRMQAGLAEWQALGKAIDERAPPMATVLIPTDALRDGADAADSGAFAYYARRPEWVNFKAGAAVMWQPAYHDEWQRRVAEVQALKGWDDWLAYAHRNALAFVIAPCAGLPPAVPVALRSAHYCAVPVGP